MRTLCDVRPGVTNIASMVKKMLEALEKHLTDFAFREVRDALVKLRQLGRIMTGPVALCCECEPLVFEELNVLCILHFETAGEELSKLGKMYALLEVSPNASNGDLRHAVRQKSEKYDADGVCDMLQRIVVQSSFCSFSRRICMDSSSPRCSIPSCFKFQSRSIRWSLRTCFTHGGGADRGPQCSEGARTRFGERDLCFLVQPSRGRVRSQETR